MLDSVHCLGLLVMVHHDDLLALQIQQVPSGNHTHIIVVLVHNREIPVALLPHDLPDIFRLLIHIEHGQVVRFHKVLNGHTLIDQSGCRKCIQRRADYYAVVLLGQLLDGYGHLGSLADNDAAGLHLDGAELGFITVAQDYQIPFLDIVFHQIRIGRGNQHLALIVIIFGRTYQNLAFQRINDVAVLGIGLGQNLAVIHIHIGGGDISNSNQAFQLFLLCNRQRHHTQPPHQIPGLLQREIAAHAFRLAYLNISHLSHHIRHIHGCLRLKKVQHILGLLIQLSCPGSDIAASLHLIFQVGIGQRRADRIRIRILVSDDKYRSCQILLHDFSFQDGRFHSGPARPDRCPLSA